jgi:cell division inhibitor SepF
MAGAMRKMAVYLGLVEDDEERYEDYADGDEPEPVVRQYVNEERPSKGSVRRIEEGRVTGLSIRHGGPATAVIPDGNPTYRITTLHPRTYNEARTIGEHYREGIPVIMNLSDMDDSDAKRLVDFAAGLIFGLRGSIERVTTKVFLLSPANVDITAEDKRRIAEGGFFNQS